MSAAPWDAPTPALTSLIDAVAGQAPAEVEPERVHPFPGNVLMHVDGMGTDSEGMPDPHDETRTVVEDLDSAMVVTSLVAAQDWPNGTPWGNTEPVHRPVLDIDLGVVAVPSTTPGHWHLMLDRKLQWSKYLVLLDALADAGLVQPGYVKAARAREHTAVRVPWLRKGDEAPLLPEQRAAARARDIETAARDLLTLKGEAAQQAEARLRELLGPDPLADLRARLTSAPQTGA